MTIEEAGSVSTRMPCEAQGSAHQRVLQTIADAGGWLPFDRFMAIALYEPGLGYYTRDSRQFGTMPASGSDFVTAPELSPWFGAALARQVRQALTAAGSGEVCEFGAGSGALAEQLLDALGDACTRYSIVDVSTALRARQQQRLARFGERVRWLDRLPSRINGVVVGNEVLDAMPVQLLHFDGQQWFERGVALCGTSSETLVWMDRATALHPPSAGSAFVPGTVTEIHRQAEAFIATLAEHLGCGAAFFIDYGFPEREYYHPQRVGGTLMCHRAHLVDDAPLQGVGDKDITAHVNFSAVALAAQEAGMTVAGYTSQARFLLNCGLPELLQSAAPRELPAAHKLIAEHEMGELFKVIALTRGLPADFEAIGFAAGDRTHTL